MAIISKHNDDNIVLYDRYDSPFIFCKVKDPAKNWHRKSTHKKNTTDALKIAEDWFIELRYAHSRGWATKRRTFGSVADLYLKELREEVALGFKNARNLKDYSAIVKTYLRPFYNRKYIDMIKIKDIADYHIWRAEYWVTGPGSKIKHLTYELNGKTIRRKRPKGSIPSHSTRNVETVVLRAIFNTALKYEYITPAQLPTIKIPNNSDRSKNPRPAFTKKDYDTFIKFLDEWPREKNCKNKDKRWLLNQYVVFLFHTGLRPGKETDQLCWKHLREKKMEDGQMRFVLTVPKKTKTGYRYPVANDPAHSALTKIKINLMTNGINVTEDMPIFTMPNGQHVTHVGFRQTFEKALEKSGTMYDAKGSKRCPYSLRHTYATFQLVYNRVSVYTLARQMGCGVKMIEDFYGDLTPEMAIDELTSKSVDNFIL